uniref:Helicase ATP-binding domain-containing protein n=1 Tax=Panagrolaimus davidi TaxID=227884 RepID=A0A914PC79_9BILA
MDESEENPEADGVKDTIKSEMDETPKPSRKRSLCIVPEYKPLPMNRIQILLPKELEPYQSQRNIMVRIINCYKNRQNALIESPTGSGKTLALLASACGCVLDYKVKHGSGAIIDELQRNNNGLESVVEN